MHTEEKIHLGPGEAIFRTYTPLKSGSHAATICQFAADFKSGPSLRASAKRVVKSKKDKTEPLIQLDQIASEAKTDWLRALSLYEAGKLPKPDSVNRLPSWKISRKPSVVKALQLDAAARIKKQTP